MFVLRFLDPVGIVRLISDKERAIWKRIRICSVQKSVRLY